MRALLFLFIFLPILGFTQFPSTDVVDPLNINEWIKAGLDTSLIPAEVEFQAQDVINFTTHNGVKSIRSDSFQLVIDALPIGGERVIFFPEGEYEFIMNYDDRFIFMPANLILRGAGADKTIFHLVAENDSSVSFLNFKEVNSGVEYLKVDASNIYSSTYVQDEDEAELLAVNKDVFRFYYTSNCWLLGVETFMGLGSTVYIVASDHIWIHGCHFNEAWLHGNHQNFGLQGYGVVFGGDSLTYSNHCLIENNIFEHFRHAINLQYHAKHNVIAYNYTLLSRAYNFINGFKFNSLTADFVLHGNGANNNLIEGNIFGGGGLANGLNIDRVKVVDNGPNNVLYRNFVQAGLVIQTDQCDYNQDQTVVANQSQDFYILGDGHQLFCNIDSSGILASDVGTVCSSGADYLNPCEEEKLGISCYFETKPCWMNNVNLPTIGNVGSGYYSNLAKERYALNVKAILTTECPEITGVYDQVEQIQMYPNPVYNYVQFTNLKIGAQLNVYNVLGQLVSSQMLKQQNVMLRTDSWEKGLYVVQVKAESGEIKGWSKFLKQ